MKGLKSVTIAGIDFVIQAYRKTDFVTLACTGSISSITIDFDNGDFSSHGKETAVHLCLCGCGNLSVTHFMDDTGWKVTLTQGNGRDPGGLTIVPSILNTNCPKRYHYIITDNVANVV